MSNLTKEECLNYKNELQFAYDHVGTRLDNVSLKDAISLGMVGYEKLMNEHFDNQLNMEEIEFLLMSEEERFNRFGQMYAYELYVSSKEKLEKQKEMLKE